jgi:beta-phosphoglucomutase-like phosphatase (HAD superfamily)
MFSHITHLIYDMDGLLLDTESLYSIAATEVCARYHQTYNWSIKAKILGRPSLESATDLVKWLALPISPQAYLLQRNIILEDLFPHALVMPGAKHLTEICLKNQIPQAIATSSDRFFFEIKSQKHRDWFASVFTLVLTGDDPSVKKGKPSPDIFLSAAHKLKANPKQCLVFEDSPAGVQAAINAGMMVVAVPDKECDKSFVQGATLILNSLEEFDIDWLLTPGGNTIRDSHF